MTLTERHQAEREGPPSNSHVSEGTQPSEEVAMPILLWLLGVPVTLVLVLWFFGIVGF
jgi:hypothetical protein